MAEAEVEGRKWKGGRSERAEVKGRKWNDGSGSGSVEVGRADTGVKGGSRRTGTVEVEGRE